MQRLMLFSAVLFLSACRSSTDAPTVTLSPTSPTTVDDLVAGVDNCDDCKYRWFKDGEPEGEITGETVSANLTTKGETWSLVVTAQLEDGTEGLPGEAQTVIVNSPPLLGELSISPSEEVYTNDILTASIDASDADGDEFTVSYSWLVDDVAAGVDADTLDGLDHFDKGQEVSVTVTVTDREDEAQASSEVLTVLNSPPTAPGVAIDRVNGTSDCYSLYFDGQDDYGDVPVDSALEFPSQDYTFEVWARFDGEKIGGDLISHRSTSGGFNFGAKTYLEGDAVAMSNGCCGGGPGQYFNETEGYHDEWTVPDIGSGWHHIATVHDSTNEETRFWVDGIETALSTKFDSLKNSGVGLWFARERINSHEYNEITLGGARLSDGQRYTNEFEPFWPLELDSDTRLVWAMNDGTGSSIREASSNQLDATLHGGVTWLQDCPSMSTDNVCVIEAHSEDLDGDEIAYDFSWYVGETEFLDTETTDHEGDTVPEDELIEEGVWTCTVTPDDGEEDGEPGSDSITVFNCGNGQLESGEQCDDGGLTNYDGCDSSCQFSCELDPNASPVGGQDFESSWGTAACGNSFIGTTGYSGKGIRPSSHWAQLIVASGGSNVKPTAFSYYQLLQSGSLGSEVKMGFGTDAQCVGVYARAKGLRTSTNLNWAEGDKDHTRVFLHETASEAPEDWVGVDHEMVEDGVWQQVIVFIQDDWQLTCLGGEVVLESNLDASQVSSGTHITIGAWADSAVPSESYPIIDEIQVWQ